MPQPVLSRVALVTGCASCIGQAIVRRLIANGARTVFTDIDETAGGRMEAEAGGAARFLRADATVEADAERSIAETLAAFGRLDVAVHNVGNFGPGDAAGTGLEAMAVQAWDNPLRPCLRSEAHTAELPSPM